VWRSKSRPLVRGVMPCSQAPDRGPGCKASRRERVACFYSATLAWNSTAVDNGLLQTLETIATLGDDRAVSLPPMAA